MGLKGRFITHLPCQAVNQGLVLVDFLKLFLFCLFRSILTTRDAWYSMLKVVSAVNQLSVEALTLMST